MKHGQSFKTMAITINGNGTVTGVSVGGLPDGIVDTDMIAAKAATAPKLGNGAILQIKSALKTDVFSTSSTSFTDITGLSVDITPTSSSSKFLVAYHVTVGHDTSTQNTIQLVRQVSSSDTVINPQAYNSGTTLQFFGSSDPGWDRGVMVYQVIDSPATASAVNYRLRTYIYSASYVQYINRCGNSASATGTSTLTVQEIAQ